MNTAHKGRKREYRSIRLLESAGYVCTRAAASKGVFDIWALSAVDVLLVNVKANVWPGSLEMEAMKLFVAPPNARKLIHRWRDNAHQPDVKEVA